MTDIEFNETEEGTLITANDFHIFFGNADFAPHDISSKVRGNLFSSLHQVHGTSCVEAFGKERPFTDEIKADAQWTNILGLTLIIKTADCLPILCFDPYDKVVYAIHAGWRGLFDGIVEKSLENVRYRQDLLVFIGPHIHVENYEVGEEFRDKVSYIFPGKEGLIKSFGNKLCLDLTLALQTKLHALGVLEENTWVSPADTFTNEDYNSYRRGKDKGRNLSLIELVT